jgi:hypothetical protein
MRHNVRMTTDSAHPSNGTKSLASGNSAQDQPPSDWTASEKAMWIAYRDGGMLDLSDADPTQNDPANGAGWNDRRTLRADVVAQILIHSPRVNPGNPDRFRLVGARISGELDLGCASIVAFLFTNCRFDQVINLSDATAAFIGFHHCNFPGVIASRLKCKGPLWFDGSETTGTISLEDTVIQGEASFNSVKLTGQNNMNRLNLSGASIHGDLELNDAHVSGSVYLLGSRIYGSLSLFKAKIESSGPTIMARLADITGDVRADEKFESKGTMNMEGAHIGGQCILKGSRLVNPGKVALDLDHSRIDLGLVARELVTDGEIQIHHARIGCQVSFANSHLSNPNDIAIRGDHLIVDGSLFINGNAKVNGQINLHGADIGCTLNIRSSEISSNDGPAIEADGISVGRNVLASKSRISGGILLGDAKIGGVVGLRDAQFDEVGKYAINADRAQMGGAFLINGDFMARSPVSLQDAAIGTSLEFSDAQLSKSNSPCLMASGLRVQGDIVGDRAKIAGLLDLAAVSVSGDVRIADAEISGIRAQEYSLGTPIDHRKGGVWRGVSLRMTGSSVAGDLDLRGTTFKQALIISAMQVSRSVMLTGATLEATEGSALLAAGLHSDSLEIQFKARPEMKIDLGSTVVNSLVDTTMSWPESAPVNLIGFNYGRLSSELTPKQRLAWLASAVRKYSPQPYEQLATYYLENGDADHARDVRLASIRRSYESRGALARIWGSIQDWSLGFGYRPFRAAVIFVFLWAAGSLFFTLATGPCFRFGTRWANLCPTAPDGHLAWNAWLFSFDSLVPVVNLGYKTAWNASGWSEIVVLILTVSGWILTTTIVAAVARKLKRS